jgi:hypothetical protein
MRFLRYLALLAAVTFVLMLTPKADAQVVLGYGAPYAYAAPACTYGYYDYAPYACAPYGYYGPEWFSGGIFIGAGPWFRGGYGYRGGYAGYGYRGGYGYGGYRGGYGYGGYRGGAGYGGGFHGGGGGGGGGAHGGGHR